jgi:gas vesicle protein GvpN
VTTVLRASPRRFVSTPAVERVATRALRYLQSGFSVHLRGPAGTGKTTLALHLADLLTRPIMLIFGDDEFKTSDLIGNQSGYTRKKVVDNFIHSVVKVEDELRQNWVDSRLTLACREGFTLVYDEFNRSRPEVNNVLLSALEEKLLVLPPSGNRNEYIRVNPQFRAIFTSNPEEYCGVHATQDALLDRLITINMPEPDELTQQEILVQKTEICRASALLIVRLVKAFWVRTGTDKVSGLRSCLMIAKVCQEHEILVAPESVDFRDVCCDVLLSRSSLPMAEATKILWELLNGLVGTHWEFTEDSELSNPATLEPKRELIAAPAPEPAVSTTVAPTSVVTTDASDVEPEPISVVMVPEAIVVEEAEAEAVEASIVPQVDPLEEATAQELTTPHTPPEFPEELAAPGLPYAEVALTSLATPYEQAIYDYLQQSGGARLTQIEMDLQLDRFHTVDTLRVLMEKGRVLQRDRLFLIQEAA